MNSVMQVEVRIVINKGNSGLKLAFVGTVGCYKFAPPFVKINKMEYVIGSLKNSGDLIGRSYKGRVVLGD
jgi:hypothetical protein